MKNIVGVFGLMWKLHIAVVFFVTALFFYPLIFPFLFSEKGKKQSFKLFVAWSWAFRLLCFYFVKRLKSSELPKAPYLIIANHISYLDIFLMYSIFPKNHFLFLGKSEILKYPLIKTYFKRLNIPVHRENRVKAAKSLIHAAKAVKSGWSLVIFPEGGIPDENPGMIDFKAGAFQLAKSVKLPIVPLTYINNHRLFSDPTFILGPARPGVCQLYIHDAISVDEIEGMTQKELRDHCHEIINAPLLRHYPHLKEANEVPPKQK